MLNKLVKWATGKDIILYQKHSRHTQPLISDMNNRQRFWFIEIGVIWRFIPFKSTNKRKYKIMYLILQWMHPKVILDCNWITKNQILYKVWAAKNPDSKFVVLQHGVYAGGKVIAVSHKYAHCDIFLTWGTYFVDIFKEYNSQNKVDIVCFGNTIYNGFDRTNFTYKENKTNKILLLPTALDHKNILHFYDLLERLTDLKFDIEVEEHYKQGKEKNKDGTLKYPSIEGVKKITGPLYQILLNNEYDFIISDHSTALLDAIFFKQKVVYFDPTNISKGYNTNYSSYLANLYSEKLTEIDKDEIYSLINIENQEKLISDMIFFGDNRLDILIDSGIRSRD